MAALATALGLALRLDDLDATSLWLDEGSTVAVARLPWPTLLGLRGAFDTHPPFFYVLVKVVTTLAGELHAARLVSVAAGTLTIPVVFALGRRLLSPSAGAIASLLLATSPIHVYYSREGRPYALATLLVGLSYLLLCRYEEEPGPAVAALYGGTLALAAYTEYSTLYALAPQALLLARAAGSGSRGALLAAGGAALSFLPWLGRAVGAARTIDGARPAYLELSASKVGLSVLSLAGVAGDGGYYWGRLAAPWNRWPAARAFIALEVALVLGLGVAVLVSTRRRATLVVGCGLLVSPILCTVAVSLVVPSYVDRAVLATVLGVALLGAAAATAASRWSRAAGVVATALLVATSAVTLDALRRGLEKQRWRDLAAATVLKARFGGRVVTFPAQAEVLLHLYAPGLRSLDGEASPGMPGIGSGPVWLAYLEVAGAERLRADLRARGFRRLLHEEWVGQVHLDLWATPGQDLGTAIALTPFPVGAGAASGWELPAGARVEPEGAGFRLLLPNDGPAEVRAAQRVDAEEDTLYVLAFDVRASHSSATPSAYLLAYSAAGEMVQAAPISEEAALGDGDWHRIRIALLPPRGCRWVAADLRNAGRGAVEYRDVTLHGVGLPTPAPRETKRPPAMEGPSR